MMLRPSDKCDKCDPLEGWKEKVDYALEVALAAKSKVEAFEPYVHLFIEQVEGFIDSLKDLKEQVDLNIIDIDSLEERVIEIDETLVIIGTALSGLRDDVDANTNAIEAIEGDISDIHTALDSKVTANADITGATKCKITYDTKGLVTAGADLIASDIPALDTAKITSGTFADARIPNLNGSKITAGTVADARLPTTVERTSNKKSAWQTTPTDTSYPSEKLVKTALDAKVDFNPLISGATKTKITYDAKGLVTAGADLVASDIPYQPASKINSGTFADARIPTLAISKTTGLQSALDAKIPTSVKGSPNGVAELDATGKVPSGQLPSYVDDVLEYASLVGFPTTGESGKIYVAIDTNKTYRWSGTGYVEISPSLAIGETSATAYRGDRGAQAYAHISATNNPHSVTKAQVGLSNVADVLQYSASNPPPYPVTSVAGKTGAVVLAEADIPALGTGKITSGTFVDARIPALAISKITNLQTTLDGKIPSIEKGSINGVATLGGDGKVPYTQLPAGLSVNTSWGSPLSDTTVPSEKLVKGSLDLKVSTNNAITAGTKAKITYDSKGLVTSGADLVADDIPGLPASKITSGSFPSSRLPALDASKITSGTFADARIPALAISKITGLQTALDGKQDKLTFDNAPVSGSNNPVKSGGVHSALTGKQDAFSLYEHTINVTCTIGANFGFSLTVLNQSATAFTLPTLHDYLGSMENDYKQCSGVVWYVGNSVNLIGVRGGLTNEFLVQGMNMETGDPYQLISFNWTQVEIQLLDKVRQIV